MRYAYPIFLVVLTWCPPALAVFSVSLDMDTDPVSEGWTLTSLGEGSHSVAGGILTVNSPFFYEFSDPSRWLANVDTKWTISTRVRLTDFQDSFPTGPDPAVRVWAHDDMSVVIFDITPDRVLLTQSAIQDPSALLGEHLLDTSVFHDYKIVADGPSVQLFVDHEPALDVLRSNVSGTETIFFGDGAHANPTVSEWDYFRYVVPEPSHSMCLLGLVPMLLAARRRSRRFEDCAEAGKRPGGAFEPLGLPDPPGPFFIRPAC